jgi:hypothetical protein
MSHEVTIEIRDEKQWLSKPQKTKIRRWLIEHNMSSTLFFQDLLSTIHYPEGITGYKGVSVHETRPNVYEVTFHESDTRNVLRHRLQNTLRQKRNTRVVHYKNSHAWQMYSRLTKEAFCQVLTEEQRSVMLPEPPHVKKNKTMYESMSTLEHVPQILREYWKACLDE